jgi:hypothetical protein
VRSGDQQRPQLARKQHDARMNRGRNRNRRRPRGLNQQTGPARIANADPAQSPHRPQLCRIHAAAFLLRLPRTIGQILDSKKPLKTECFQGLIVWLRG